MSRVLNRSNTAYCAAAGLILFGILSGVRADDPPAAASDPNQPAPASANPQASPAQNSAQQPGQPVGGGPPPLVVGVPITGEQKPGDGPRIVFDTPTYDFGRMMSGNPVRHDFWFTNRGNQPLEITAVRASCGCTTAGQWDKLVEPGKTGKIPVVVTTEKFRGEVSKTVTVTTNAPGQEQITLWVKGTLWQPVEMNPNYLNFGSIIDNKERTLMVDITNNLEDPIELKNPKCDNPLYRLEIEPVEPGKKFKLRVTALPPFKLGQNPGNITVETSSPSAAKLTLTASLYSPPAVEITPPILRLPGGPLPSSLERAIYVTHNTGTPMAISELKVNHEEVSVRMVEDVKGQRFRIILNFPQGVEIKSGGAMQLSFKTDDPTAPQVTIPIESFNIGPVAQPTTPYRTPITGAKPGTPATPAAPPAPPPAPAAGSGAVPGKG